MRVPLRTGAAMLSLLVILVFLGLAASYLLPEAETLEVRTKETELKATLADIRMALDLKTLASNPYFLATTSQVPWSMIETELASLAAKGYLRSAKLADPGVPGYMWLNGSHAWQVRQNIPNNNSFESLIAPNIASNEFVASWSRKPGETFVATDTEFFPGQADTAYDDYPGQNKFGNVLATSGQSIRITR